MNIPSLISRLRLREYGLVALAGGQHDVGICFDDTGTLLIYMSSFQRRRIVRRDLQNIIEVARDIMAFQYLVFALNILQEGFDKPGFSRLTNNERG
jgi:hypothetical protein